MKNYFQSKRLALALLTTLALPIALPAVLPISVNAVIQPEISATPVIPIPDSLPKDSKVRVDGDVSMKGMNALLKAKLESRFPGSTVELAESTSAGALKALEDGKLDIAAIGRPLTEDEKARGFVEVPIAYNKIGIFVGADNPFAASLTNTQFAKIFRGEIKDWSEVGGTAGPIVLIDRPDSNDTRASFARYPVFKEAAFSAGATATKIDADTNDAVVSKLGKTGIGYALAEQVTGKSDLKIVPLHKVLPDDPRYSFSQPLAYVYRDAASPAVKAFLGLAQDPANAAEIEVARKAGVGTTTTTAAVPLNAPATTAAPSTTSTAAPPTDIAISPGTATDKPGGIGFNPWWLVPILGLPLLTFAALRGKSEENELPIAPIAGAGLAGAGLAGAALWGKNRTKLIAVPRDCRNIYSYWELNDAQAKEVRSQSGQKLALRAYDVTDDDLKRPDRTQFTQVDIHDGEPDRHHEIPRENRDYITELGYMTAKNEWIKLATSDVIHIPSCDRESDRPGFVQPGTQRGTNVQSGTPNIDDAVTAGLTAAIGAAGLAGATAAGFQSSNVESDRTTGMTTGSDTSPKVSHIILVPKDKRNAYAYWELNPNDRDRVMAEGGQQFVLRISDAHGQAIDGLNHHSFRQYDLTSDSTDYHFHLPAPDRDYVAEVGYLTRDQRWIGLARSTPVYCGNVEAELG